MFCEVLAGSDMMPPCGLAFGQVNLLRRYPSGGRKAGPEAVGDMRGNEKPPRGAAGMLIMHTLILHIFKEDILTPEASLSLPFVPAYASHRILFRRGVG